MKDIFAVKVSKYGIGVKWLDPIKKHIIDQMPVDYGRNIEVYFKNFPRRRLIFRLLYKRVIDK